jgi:hypothetical protein
LGNLDTLTTLVGLGILGYVSYTVLIPYSASIINAVATTPTTATPTPKPKTTTTTTAPTVATTTGGGSIIYDSSKGWTGVTTAASGNPKWTTEAGGVGKLSCGSGHCRVYIAVKNHNARMEGEYMYTGAVTNLSLRLRSRHQEGGSCENRFGGFGAAIQKSGEVEFQTESCHNNHENSKSGQQSPAPVAGKWYKFAYSCWDSSDKKSVNFKLDINGKTVLTGNHPSPKPYFMDEALHNQKSYIWLRSNNSGSGTISFRNFKVYNLGKSGTASLHAKSFMMKDQPFMFNRFYHGRRM